ncbi:DUF4142 domain-containing protein [Sphingomonas sp. GCM10030256]|uniref:DUF4142 domain-containing protein n=1 Tax=Sphingomonas sp. GCM10030256 TaxID=3273427 RepID=UPI0036084561
MRNSAVVLSLAGALLLSACGTTPQPRTPPPVVVVEPRPAQVLSPAAYVQRAASLDLFVVRASEMALQRSTDPRTRGLAERMLADHRGLAGQLSLAGRRLNLLPAAAMLPEQQGELDLLSRSRPIETGYQRRVMVAHQEALQLHGDFARAGSSPTLRPVAANAERVERRHLTELPGR